jgi:hypothetical protein
MAAASALRSGGLQPAGLFKRRLISIASRLKKERRLSTPCGRWAVWKAPFLDATEEADRFSLAADAGRVRRRNSDKPRPSHRCTSRKRCIRKHKCKLQRPCPVCARTFRRPISFPTPLLPFAPLRRFTTSLPCSADLHERFRSDAYGQLHHHARAQDGDF